MDSSFWGRILAAVLQGLLSSLFGEARNRRTESERNDAIVGHALEKQAAENLERRNQIRKDMADAQSTAPRNRDDLARRMRAEAAAEAGADEAGDGVPVVAGRGEGTEVPAG